ncbi:MAG: PEP-CTERM sorting domain-containing protein [Nitrosomonas sp.]|nr:PEP-CTERM sorting domain-containing protein [Nitrosomonas sp.]
MPEPETHSMLIGIGLMGFYGAEGFIG